MGRGCGSLVGLASLQRLLVSETLLTQVRIPAAENDLYLKFTLFEIYEVIECSRRE